VRALVRVAEAGEAGGIYHVAERSTPTLREFYEEIQRHTGGTPVRFWSTWVPSYVQTWGARLNERVQSRAGTRPRFTPDNLKLFTNSVRANVGRLNEELQFDWRFPEYEAGISEAFRDPA
jgi:nucleoside-diphosphate-sugar epimerase